MKLILTEKPSVSRQVKDAIAPDARFQTLKHPKGQPPIGFYENDQFLICNSVGHIVRLQTPKEIDAARYGWSLEDLPYQMPDPIPLVIDNPPVFEAIQTCMDRHAYDEIIIATDGDREGQNIWRKIALKLHFQNPSCPVSRMWLSEWTKAGILRAYAERFDNAQKDSLADAARCREEADYLIGMNCTAALTAAYSRGAGVLSIGRVMGPTMRIVVDREKEITGFVPKPYAVLELHVSNPKTTPPLILSSLPAQLDSTQAQSLLSSFSGTVTLHKSAKIQSKPSPELYDATSLAQEMNKRYGYSTKETADIIQKLYQKDTLITYPGTNSTKISTGSAGQVSQILAHLPIFQDRVLQIQNQAWTIAPHHVTEEGLAHEAITPVYGSVSANALEHLSAKERNVYEAICLRFLEAFYPPYMTEEVTLSANLDGIRLQAKGRSVQQKGWMELEPPVKDQLLPFLEDGAIVSGLLKRVDKQTQPPNRYTEATLLAAMKNAGRFVDDARDIQTLKSVEGLGTARTRPAILENIKHRGYFQLKGKTIYPTSKCMELFELIPETTITSPSLTAHFEQMIQDVEEGRMNVNDYLSDVQSDVAAMIEAIKADSSSKTIQGGTGMDNTWGVCPICGRPMQENAKAVCCSGWKEGCGFTIWKTQFGKTLREAEIREIIENKGTLKPIRNFRSKAGKSFDANLKWDENERRFVLEFVSGRRSV